MEVWGVAAARQLPKFLPAGTVGGGRSHSKIAPSFRSALNPSKSRARFEAAGLRCGGQFSLGQTALHTTRSERLFGGNELVWASQRCVQGARDHAEASLPITSGKPQGTRHEVVKIDYQDWGQV